MTFKTCISNIVFILLVTLTYCYKTSEATRNQFQQLNNVFKSNNNPSLLLVSKQNNINLVTKYKSFHSIFQRGGGGGGGFHDIVVVEELQDEVIRLRKLLDENGIINNEKSNNDTDKKDTIINSTETTFNKNKVCTYINQILNERLHQVSNKQRSKWFAKNYKKQLDCIDGEYTIISGHGRENNDNNNNNNNNNNHVDEKQNNGYDQAKANLLLKQKQHEIIIINNTTCAVVTNSDDFKSIGTAITNNDIIFPNDFLSLDMVFTEQIYNHAIKEINIKQNNEVSDHHSMYELEKLFIPKLFMRAIQLGWNFTPVTLTMALAVYSKSFRDNVWYNLVGRCLAKSGPAFIKWGEFKKKL